MPPRERSAVTLGASAVLGKKLDKSQVDSRQRPHAAADVSMDVGAAHYAEKVRCPPALLLLTQQPASYSYPPVRSLVWIRRYIGTLAGAAREAVHEGAKVDEGDADQGPVVL